MADCQPVALVTGGGRGIGAEVVRALAARGYAVAIHCHASLREARALAAEIVAAGGQAMAVTANFREEGAVRALLHRVTDWLGRIDVVVGCARLCRESAFKELAGGDLMAHYEVNVVGTFVVAQEAAAVMARQAEGGVIVALAVSEEARAGRLSFATSQAAIPALMQSLAAEFADHSPRVHAGCVVMTDETPAGIAATLVDQIDGTRQAR
jgi:3-oxoacyl-[acyl-carrier protein] reductase